MLPSIEFGKKGCPDRWPNRPKPLTEVADRFHLTPLIRAMTSPHDVFVLALSEERVRLMHVFVSLPRFVNYTVNGSLGLCRCFKKRISLSSPISLS
jgi:hypothetical protein